MTPGLHELECNNCGAPINPPAESTVVRCDHCGQPHMWVAPQSSGEQGRWMVQQAPAGRGGALKWLLLGGAVLVALAAAGVVAGILMWSKGARGGSGEAPVTADTPLTIGDDVTVHTTKNHSCQSYVAALLGDGRVRVADCGGGDSPLSAARSLLTLDTYSFRKPAVDDVVLWRVAGRWQRFVVVGLDAGGHVRVEPLLGGNGESVDPKALRVVWRHDGSSAGFRWVPPPAGAAFAVGDVVGYRDAGVIKSGKVTRIDGARLELLPGYLDHGTFAPEKDATPTRRAQNTLLLQLASPSSPPGPWQTLLVQKEGKWQRVKLASTDEHGRWGVQDSDGHQRVVWGGHALELPHAR
jgi:hypothetical protein